MNTTHLTIQDHIATLEFDNAPNNRLSRGLMGAFEEAIAEIKTNGAVRAVVLCGRGENFSHGGDISIWPGVSPQDMAVRIAASVKRANLLEDLPIPTIAAVRGDCLGGGFEYALRCDLIIAAQGARFAHTEQSLGVFTLLVVQRVAERAGRARAIKWALSSERVSAQELVDAGVVTEVVPSDQLAARAQAWARRLADGPTLAHAAHKRLPREVGQRRHGCRPSHTGTGRADIRFRRRATRRRFGARRAGARRPETCPEVRGPMTCRASMRPFGPTPRKRSKTGFSAITCPPGSPLAPTAQARTSFPPTGATPCTCARTASRGTRPAGTTWSPFWTRCTRGCDRRGYSTTRVLDRRIRIYNERGASVEVIWSRQRADASEIERIAVHFEVSKLQLRVACRFHPVHPRSSRHAGRGLVGHQAATAMSKTHPEYPALVLPAHVSRKAVRIWNNGMALDGDLYKPTSLAGSAARAPVVVMSHGLGGSKRTAERYAAEFADLGVVALTFTHAGWPESDSHLYRASGAAGESQASARMANQVVDPLEWVQSMRVRLDFLEGEDNVDIERLGAWGTSFGGGIALFAACNDDRIKALAIQVGSVAGIRPALARHARQRAIDMARGILPSVPDASMDQFPTAPAFRTTRACAAIVR